MKNSEEYKATLNFSEMVNAYLSYCPSRFWVWIEWGGTFCLPRPTISQPLGVTES